MASWEKVAHALASRMYHQAHCRDHAENTEGCPFCDDRAAYELYEAKLDEVSKRIRKYANEGRSARE